MNLNKHLEFFDPFNIKDEIHIVGVGAVGSRIAEQLVRLGVTELHLYDFDKVEDVNITNQIYYFDQIGKTKLEAIREILQRINPQVKLKLHTEGYKEGLLNGFVFMAVDSIEVRQQIVSQNKYNLDTKAVFDVRMRLTDAQSYAANWAKPKHIKLLENTMDFTEEEAKEATPISACGTTLSVSPLVSTLAALTVSNFMNFIRKGTLENTILLDVFDFNITPITYK